MDTITKSTFDYIKENIFVIIDKEVQHITDDGDSCVISYMFNKSLPLSYNFGNCIWTSSWEIFNRGKADLYTFSFFDVCGACASLYDYYRLRTWMPGIGDCFVRYDDQYIPAQGCFCKNNRELIVKAVWEVLKSYNLLCDEDT